MAAEIGCRGFHCCIGSNAGLDCWASCPHVQPHRASHSQWLWVHCNWLTVADSASGAAASHTIAHNLNSEFVEVQLWVKSPDDGKYRMDIAEVVEQDNNTLEVVMNAPRDIKIIVEKRYA